MWNATYTQSGEQVSATNANYGGSIWPGGSVTVGFTGTYTSNNTPPASFTMNGSACST